MEEQKYITPKVGVAHLLASNDEEAMKITRKLLSYLPQNNIDPVEIFPYDETYRLSEDINSIVSPDPKKSYDVKNIIELVFDPDSFF